MINSKKKGFTIVELVIVIAVIAILSAVLIPTFSNLVRKANISSDTVLAKNLNTALSLYGSENDVDDFDAALKGIKEHGYLISNLNAKTKGCFYVWEKETNQILLVDSTENYKVLFSVRDGYGEPDASWHFAISNKGIAQKVTTDLPSVTIMQTVANVKDLSVLLQESNGKPIYIDESIILTKENLITIKNSNVTLNLGESSLNTNGLISNDIPILVESGSLMLNGGIIGAAGSYIDADGRLVNTPIKTAENTNVIIDGTTFNINENGYVTFFGEALVKNATFNSQGTTIYAGNKANVTLENVTVSSTNRCVWATCYNGYDHDRSDGIATIIIKSGNYVGGCNDYSAISVYSGDVVIEGGDFTSNEGISHLFQVMYTGSITIKGGTFNGISFNKLTLDLVKSLCKNNETVAENNDGSFKITI